MALSVVVKINGKTMSDVEMALEEVNRKILDGFTSGNDKNEFGSFSFDVTGEEDEMEVE